MTANEAWSHPLADVRSQTIGKGSKVWQFSVVLPGAQLGEDCNVNANCFIENDVVLGDRVTVKCGVQLWDGLRIGDDVFIGPNATFTNDLFPRSKVYPAQFKATYVRKGASIGANATVLAGVTIGEYAMVGAGSVVTSDIPPGEVWFGNPARFSGKLAPRKDAQEKVDMKIPFLDLKGINERQKAQLTDAFVRVLDSGWYVLGEQCAAFEQEFAAYCGATHCVGVASGLDALVLALKAFDIGPGDEVIVPSNTYIATWLAVTQVGAVPVPVEPDARTLNIDASRLAKALTPRTRAIMPVHLYGQAVDLDAVLAFAKDNSLKVIEDAAQAHGARYKGQRIGNHGDAVAWSYYPGKNLGALGDGGAVTTSHANVAEKVRLLRNYGSRVKYHNEVQGMNSRLDELQAALLRVKLPLLDSDNAHRAKIAALYLSELQDSGLTLPFIDPACQSAWHLFVVQHPQRDRLAQALASEGVGTVIHYPIPPHLQPAYAELGYIKGSLPVSEAAHSQVLSLPIGPTLSLDDASRVVAVIRKVLASWS